MKFCQLVYFFEKNIKKIFSNWYVEKKQKNSQDFDPCFFGKPHKKVSCVIYF